LTYISSGSKSGWWLSHPSEKYDFVNGKDDIPYMKWKIKFMFQTSNQKIDFRPKSDGFPSRKFHSTTPGTFPARNGSVNFPKELMLSNVPSDIAPAVPCTSQQTQRAPSSRRLAKATSRGDLMEHGPEWDDSTSWCWRVAPLPSAFEGE